MTKAHLECNATQYHGLHEAVSSARKGSIVVKVDKEALRVLLQDHGKLVRVCQTEGLVEGEL